MMYSHQAEIGVTKMTEFLSCKSETEYSATGRERRCEWVGGKAKGMLEFQWLIAWMPLSITPAQRNQWWKWILRSLFSGDGQEGVKEREILLNILCFPSLKRNPG